MTFCRAHRVVLFLAVGLFVLPSLSAASGTSAVIGPNLRFLQCLRSASRHLASPAVESARSRPCADASLRFKSPPAAETLMLLEAEGVEFLRYQGEILHTPTVFPARVDWARLDDLALRDDLVMVESTWRPHPQPPLDVSCSQVQAPQVWNLKDRQKRRLTGEGVLIADFDTGIDVFHPIFWRADGDTLSWFDRNKNGRFDPGWDAVDRDGDGRFDPGEILEYYEAPVFGGLSNDPATCSARLDWLFQDTNGNGARDYGPAAGFTESDPTFGEPVFVALDVNGNDSLDVGENLVALGTCKVRAVYETTGVVRRRGTDLIRSEGDTRSHGTQVAGILVGGVPGLSRMAGIAPGAELLMGNNVYVPDPPFIVSLEALIPWAAAEGADVMLYEDGEWVWNFLDGSSNVETMMDEMAAAGIPQVVPAGNLATGRMHVADTLGARDSLEVALISPPSSYVSELWPSLLWREDVARRDGTTELQAMLEAPSGARLSLDGDADYDALGPYAIYSCFSVSPRGTGKLDVHIVNATAGGPVSGEWIFHLHNRDATPVVVHGFTWDNISSWSGYSYWSGHIDGMGSTVTWPATADSAIAVAAYEPRYGDPVLNNFSGRGPRIDGAPVIDLAAPGSTVFAPVRKDEAGEPGGYGAFGGTSAAGPHVAGAMALLRQLTAGGASAARSGELLSWLTSGALVDIFTGSVPNESWGWGRLRILDALAPYAAVSSPVVAGGGGRSRRGQDLGSASSGIPLTVRPNPAAGELIVSYVVPHEGTVRVELFDVRGRRLALLHERRTNAGPATFTWKGILPSGAPLVPGTYVLQVTQGAFVARAKAIISR